MVHSSPKLIMLSADVFLTLWSITVVVFLGYGPMPNVTRKMSFQEHIGYLNYSNSWTDDLEVCNHSGIGFSRNEVYRLDGAKFLEHEYEDKTFHYKFDKDNFLYAVFDGHAGCTAVEFFFHNIPAEILLGQLSSASSDEEIKEVLRQAFVSIEKTFMELIYFYLAKKTQLIDELREVRSDLHEAKNSQIVEQLNQINKNLSSGASVALALVYKNKLYVANIGNCRMLMCKTDANNVLRVIQLSVDHDLSNEDEILRLSQLGLNINHLRRRDRIGNQDITRCLGNYNVKGSYKEFEELSAAKFCPIISDPDIHGGIALDESCKYLLLMSSGLLKTVKEYTKTEDVNKHIARLVHEQFQLQRTLHGVAQATVESIVTAHQDYTTTISRSQNLRREDITLLVRNFNYELPTAVSSALQMVTFNPVIQAHSNYNSSVGSNAMSINSDTTSSSDRPTELTPKGNADARVEAYVDFQEYRDKVERCRINGTLPLGIEF